MTAKRRWHSRWLGTGATAIGAAALLLLACVPPGTGGEPLRQHFGELDRPIEQYASTAQGRAAFRALVERNGLGWRGQSNAVRACTGAACTGGANTTADVAAIGDAHRVDLQSLPAHGVVVARLVNTGAHDEAVYDLRPGPGPGTAYYLVIERAPGPVDPARPHAVQKLVRLTTGGGPPVMSVRPLAGMFRACPAGSAHPPLDSADAAFRGCAGRGVHDPAPDTTTATGARLMRELAWISCTHGCCEMES